LSGNPVAGTDTKTETACVLLLQGHRLLAIDPWCRDLSAMPSASEAAPGGRTGLTLGRSFPDWGDYTLINRRKIRQQTVRRKKMEEIKMGTTSHSTLFPCHVVKRGGAKTTTDIPELTTCEACLRVFRAHHLKPPSAFPEIPEIPATRIKGQLIILCPKCGQIHYHGAGDPKGPIGGGDGHRASHCTGDCWPNGYYVKERCPDEVGAEQGLADSPHP
jgi:hypothetical protein